jgi:hypothetical protein
MILDIKMKNLKVYEWLREYTESGKMDIVTGYFTVGALAYLSSQINNKIEHFRMVLGDIVNIDIIQDHTIDLLNENIAIEAALKLSSVAKEAVKFLKQEKVAAKTLEPNFCHAKLYLFNPVKDDRHTGLKQPHDDWLRTDRPDRRHFWSSLDKYPYIDCHF